MDASQYEAMKYNELKSLAVERGLLGSGTKEELIARLSEVKSELPPAPSNGAAAGEKADEKIPEPVPAPATIPAKANTDEGARVRAKGMSKAMATKAALDAQPKVMVLIPLEPGENAQNSGKVPFHCGINGYTYTIPRGTMVEVPMQVAEMVRERLESEGKIGRTMRIDADPEKMTALA